MSRTFSTYHPCCWGEASRPRIPQDPRHPEQLIVLPRTRQQREPSLPFQQPFLLPSSAQRCFFSQIPAAPANGDATYSLFYPESPYSPVTNKFINVILKTPSDQTLGHDIGRLLAVTCPFLCTCDCFLAHSLLLWQRDKDMGDLESREGRWLIISEFKQGKYI